MTITQSKFIRVHDLADPSVVYRINTNAIDYYCEMHTPDYLTHYTFIKFNGDTCVKVVESVANLDSILQVMDYADNKSSKECKNCENFDLHTNMCLQHNEIGYDCDEHCLHFGCKDWQQCHGFVPPMNEEEGSE